MKTAEPAKLLLLRNKVKKWGGEIQDILQSHTQGQATIVIRKDGRSYSFSHKAKTATDATRILAWSIRSLINCDERGILPFVKTAKEFLMIEGSTETFVEADEKHFVAMGLTSKVSNDEVMRKYKTLAKDFHPDTLTELGEDSKQAFAKRFAEISEAYSEIRKARRF